ncbi:MAG: AMP phosphorylase [Candidatus Hydrothermarchaeota archaeon]|nr:MAG: AMP phosphorylase [Candidatus Hydrothermarchaeota archaeon]
MRKLKARIFDIEAGYPEVVLNINDAEDMSIHSQDRVKIILNSKRIVAVADITRTFVKPGEIGLFAEAQRLVNAKEGDVIEIMLSEKPKAVEYIKKKMEGKELTEAEIETIVKDVVSRKLSEIELTAFVSALYMRGMTMREITALSTKVATTGEMLEIDKKPIFDKHSIGGVPGNKITLLIVPIVAAAGLTIPKTSSRAITSACGTADIMEVLAPVNLTAEEIKEIVERINGVIAWGGAVNLAPADDMFIHVEYPLAIDPHCLLLSSVMAKKYAVGADFVVIDIPTGVGAKVNNLEQARKLARNFIELGENLGIKIECAITYGSQPIGRAIGPALEAREGLRALEGGETPSSLLEKACEIAGIILEAGGVASRGRGKEVAKEFIQSGKALQKMKEIIEAQGGDPNITSDDIPVGNYVEKIVAHESNYVTHIDNKAIVKIARAAGAPRDKGAGLLLYVKKGMKVEKGEVIMEIFSESEYKLTQAIKLAKELNPVKLEGMLLQRIPYSIYEY